LCDIYIYTQCPIEKRATLFLSITATFFGIFSYVLKHFVQK
jgi:hypothetical protein